MDNKNYLSNLSKLIIGFYKGVSFNQVKRFNSRSS